MKTPRRQFRTLTAKINTINISGNMASILEENMLLQLYKTHQITDKDKITFGKKGIRINHKPVKYEHGKLIYLESFRKPYIPVKVHKPHIQRNETKTIGNTMILFTNQGDKSVEIKIDIEDYPKVNMHKWHAFNYMNSVPTIVCRKKENGKWITYKFEELLGYNIKGKCRKTVIKHLNNDPFDFTKTNIKLLTNSSEN